MGRLFVASAHLSTIGKRVLLSQPPLPLDLDLIVADQIAGLDQRIGRQDLAEDAAMGAGRPVPTGWRP